jgi:membrane fusion protein (multidrug efflux system)
MNFKKFALAAALTLAAGCAQDAATNTDAATDTEATPALPADVAHLATPETPAPAAAPTGAPAGTGQDLASGIASLEPTGEFISPSQSEVAPKQPGRVAAVYVDEGSRVARGQALATLESDYLKIAVDQAAAEVVRAKAAEEDARRDFERKKGLLGNQSIPQATFDRSQGTLEQAQASRTGAEASLALARQHLADIVIRSPLTGVIGERRTNVGEHLGEAGIAFVVVQTAPLKLRFSIPERYLGEIGVGQRVSARVEPYPGESFTGTVKTVGGVIDPSNRTFFAEAEFPNRDGRLRPGLFARVTLEGKEEEGAKAR